MQGFPWKTGCPAFAPVGPGRAGPNTPDATRPVTVIGHMRQDLGQISPVCEGLPFKRSTKNQKENKQNAQKLSIPFGLFANRIYKQFCCPTDCFKQVRYSQRVGRVSAGFYPQCQNLKALT